ncbi:transposase [Mesorhizobium cantuariense]|uniref:Transposase n=1 Tax=Mesorhizobium cantuariense TaxID=1300275 RepID=A0ABV7MGB8_9HYPH
MKYLAMEQPSRVEASTPAALPLPTDAGRQRTRRSWTVEQKLAIMREVQESGDPVAVVARRHDMNANHLHIWMKQTGNGDRVTDPRPHQSLSLKWVWSVTACTM